MVAHSQACIAIHADEMIGQSMRGEQMGMLRPPGMLWERERDDTHLEPSLASLWGTTLADITGSGGYWTGGGGILRGRSSGRSGSWAGGRECTEGRGDGRGGEKEGEEPGEP